MGDCTRRNACKSYDFAILELFHRPRRSDAGEVNIVKVVPLRCSAIGIRGNPLGMYQEALFPSLRRSRTGNDFPIEHNQSCDGKLTLLKSAFSQLQDPAHVVFRCPFYSMFDQMLHSATAITLPAETQDNVEHARSIAHNSRHVGRINALLL